MLLVGPLDEMRYPWVLCVARGPQGWSKVSLSVQCVAKGSTGTEEVLD
jgi:hypothetical protein